MTGHCHLPLLPDQHQHLRLVQWVPSVSAGPGRPRHTQSQPGTSRRTQSVNHCIRMRSSCTMRTATGGHALLCALLLLDAQALLDPLPPLSDAPLPAPPGSRRCTAVSAAGLACVQFSAPSILTHLAFSSLPSHCSNAIVSGQSTGNLAPARTASTEAPIPSVEWKH